MLTSSLVLYFQFHKGAIETNLCELLKSLHTAFNSIKVRLKLKNTTNNTVFIDTFNSIKVRLKPTSSLLQVLQRYFQFHKGAIETRLLGDDYQAIIAFQFHKGAIETCQHCAYVQSVETFNSIKVRLKPAIPLLSPAIIALSIP